METYLSFLEVTPLLVVLAGAVFVHACFQLSVSVLTLLSSHTIGRRMPNNRLLSLSFWYILGVIVAITLLQFGAMAILRWGLAVNAAVTTTVTFGLIPLIALLMVLFYYRRGKGTRLWLPRPAAEYITTRAKKTKSSVEAFSLGMTTAITELPFALAPLAIVALAFQSFTTHAWPRFAVGYAVAVALPLIFVAFYISSGHKLSTIQRWRENAKDFLNWSSAAALMLLTLYIAVLQIGAAR